MTAAKRMNVVMIVSDTFRRDFLGAYGNPWISTPHLDAFAARATVFDRAYLASFPTVPHRHDVFTGRFTSAYCPWGPLPKDATVLAQVLADAGYTTMMVTDNYHLWEKGVNYERGFLGFEWIRGQENDRWKTGEPRRAACDQERLRLDGTIPHFRNRAHYRYESDRPVARTMTAACEWLEDNRGRGPFFLYVDTFDPHEPWDPPSWYVERYDPGYAGQAVEHPHYDYVDRYLTPAELNHCRAMYAGEVSLVDRWTGRLLERIQDMGLWENTMVIFTTDHGFLFGEHGVIGKAIMSPRFRWAFLPLFDEISHIPLVVRMPGGRAGRTRAVVQPPDLMPTVLEAVGAQIPKPVQGRSFLDVLRGKTRAHRRRAFSFTYAGLTGALAAVTEGRWQATLYPTHPPDGFDEVTYDADGEPRTFRRGGPPMPDRLYDLGADPACRRNVAARHGDRMKRFRRSFVELLGSCDAAPEVVRLWSRP